MKACEVVEKDCAGWKWRMQFVSDVFHAISQPLTALHCSLELALLKKVSAEQQRQTLEDALSLARRAIDSAGLVRILAEADNPGQPECIELEQVLREIVEELEPVAQECGIPLVLNILNTSRNATVIGDSARLREALFYLLDLVLQDPGTEEITVDLRAEGDSWLLELKHTGGRGRSENSGEDSQKHQRKILAEKIIVALGGELTWGQNSSEAETVVRFPVASPIIAENAMKDRQADDKV